MPRILFYPCLSDLICVQLGFNMIGVECTFEKNGRCHVRRIQIKDKWMAVEQGRQWVDRQGRHVLVRMPGQPVQEILLNPETMTWELVNGRSPIQLA